MSAVDVRPRETVTSPESQSVLSRGNATPPSVSSTMALLAGALFADPLSVSAVARYLTSHYAAPDGGALQQMDNLVHAILHAPFSLRMYGMRGLADARASAVQFVMVLELWHGVPIALPLEHAFRSGLVGLTQAVCEMIAPATRREFYRHVRRSDLDGEYILECITDGAAREMASRAWPSLLLTLCYYYYCDMLLRAVEVQNCDRSLAFDAVRASRRALDLALGQPARLVALRRNARLDVGGTLTSETLHEQLAELADILSDVELVRMTQRLLLYAGELASACTCDGD